MEQKLGSAFFADTCSLQGETMRLITKYTSASGKFPLSVIGTRASTVTRKFDKAATIRDKISQPTQSRRRSNRSSFFFVFFFLRGFISFILIHYRFDVTRKLGLSPSSTSAAEGTKISHTSRSHRNSLSDQRLLRSLLTMGEGPHSGKKQRTRSHAAVVFI